MKMVNETVEENENNLTFGDLAVGDLFVFVNSETIEPFVYQKIEEITGKNGMKYNATTLEDGDIYSIHDNEEVYEVEAELRYRIIKTSVIKIKITE